MTPSKPKASPKQRKKSPVPLERHNLYINRELSILAFNERVLAQATDVATPLLERIRFLTICSTNLDEFFEIRVAGLKQQLAFGLTQTGPDGLQPGAALARISETAHALVTRQYRILNEQLLPELADNEITVLRRTEWAARERRWVKNYFRREVLRVLTPNGLDPAHPFPRIQNKSLNFIVSLEGNDAFGRASGLAVVHAPRSLPRLIPVPTSISTSRHEFVLLSSVIHANVGDLFPGMKVTGCHQFRVTRNSDLWVDEEEIDDLLRALKGELSQRAYGDAVRLEVADTCPEDTCEFLLRQFGLAERDLYRVDGPVNLHRLSALCAKVDRPELKFGPFIPGSPADLTNAPYETLRNRDVVLHHPFESFTPVLELLRRSASDPDVLAIKMTVYRTGASSPVAEALIEAARSGKEVTAVVELKARFDEAANIELATRLQEAGANVVYGVVGFKTHCKLLLIVRREGRHLQRYVHLGTGNYHAGTTRAYTDIGLLTTRKTMTDDVHNVFLQLTGLGKTPKMKRLLQAPFTLHETLVEHVDRERRIAIEGRPARILARMNNLSEPKIIQALYRASQAGVEVDLIVRGVCCLRPGLEGISENIRVRSIIGRFLEHSRVFHFHNDGEQVTYCSSADWMERNFFRRVECAFPIEEPDLAARVVRETLEIYLEDNTQAWILQSDGTYQLAKPGRSKPRMAQSVLAKELSPAP